jgi:hypothetical protein
MSIKRCNNCIFFNYRESKCLRFPPVFTGGYYLKKALRNCVRTIDDDGVDFKDEYIWQQPYVDQCALCGEWRHK